MRRMWIFVSAVMLGLVISSCSQTTPKTSAGLQPGTRLSVSVAFAPLKEWATTVAGPDADIVTLHGEGGNAHHFAPSPQDIALIRKSNVLLAIGLGLDPWVKTVAQEGSALTILEAGTWVVRRKLNAQEEEHDHDHKPGDKDAHEHHHHHDEAGDDDPHVWLDPANAEKMVLRLGEEFAKIDPAHKTGYQERAKQYAVKLFELSRSMEQLKAKLNGKKVVTFHDAYGYMLDRVGVEVVGVVQVAPGVEPSLKDVQEAITKIKATGQKATFAEPGAEGPAQSIAKELKLPVVILDPLETPPNSSDGYIERMQRNVKALEENL